MHRAHRLAECLGKSDVAVAQDILAAGMYSIEPINNSISRRVLSMLYSPGVGAACMAIKDHPQKIDQLTLRGRSVAIVTDGSVLGVSGARVFPLMDWMVVQLKYYAGIDSYPFVVRSSATLEDVLWDLSTCYGTVLYLDPASTEGVKIPGDLLFVRQEDISKASKLDKTDGEPTARVLSALLKSKTKGPASLSLIETVLSYNPAFIQKSKSYPFEINSGDLNEQALKIHEYYQGKVQIQLNINNLQAVKQYFTTENLTKIVQQQNISSTSRQLSAIVTDGTAILGFGDIGPRAGLPVMEGKSLLFKVLGDVDVVPVCINKRKTPKQTIQAILDLCSNFQAINLQDFKAPECFEIEQTLSSKNLLPIFHDDQHGTAIVTLAAYINACKLAQKDVHKTKVVINGAGAAGLTIAKLLYAFGVKSIIVCDSSGAIYQGRKSNMNASKRELAAFTNKDKKEGNLEQVIKDSDVFVGVSVKDAFRKEWVKTMGSKPIIFAMANPDPEITYKHAMKNGCFIYGSGRSDQINQINNSLVFPGIFRGIKQHKLPQITQKMKLKTADVIAKMVGDKLAKDFIIPDSLNRDVAIQISNTLGKIQ